MEQIIICGWNPIMFEYVMSPQITKSCLYIIVYDFVRNILSPALSLAPSQLLHQAKLACICSKRPRPGETLESHPHKAVEGPPRDRF
ncbi:unnamed protein product [Moneuplotes crassus]|uniref:Uncharacterized protein n=1 Tax=Euplotes crassus TaxID=5936 RepID=A0AAD2D9B6_EUPCR|nr:unnamed protein product [Moneuplotes crassus]